MSSAKGQSQADAEREHAALRARYGFSVRVWLRLLSSPITAASFLRFALDFFFTKVGPRCCF